MAVEITPDGAFPELFSEYVEYKETSATSTRKAGST